MSDPRIIGCSDSQGLPTAFLCVHLERRGSAIMSDPPKYQCSDDQGVPTAVFVRTFEKPEALP